MKKSQEKNVYSKLFSNTVIFAIGSFSSKILVFVLLPLYTRALSTTEYGKVDLIIQLENLLLPVVTLCVGESLIRFGLDKKYDSKKVFTTASIIALLGVTLITVLMPAFNHVSYIKGYNTLFYIYMITATVKLIFAEYVRSTGNVKLYAFNGLLTTFFMIVFNILFLAVFKIGIAGYLSAIILSDLISAIFLFFIAKLYNCFSFKFFDKTMAKEMLKYSLPLIPATVMWWITNVSDRYLVKYFLGSDSNGIYSVAYKLPSILTSVYAMFNQAWNMSAIVENENKQKSTFYKNMFDVNSTVLYVVCAGIMIVLIPYIRILDRSYFSAYRYAPILLIATVFSCNCSFLSTIYLTAKKTMSALITTSIGAVLNIILNIIMIPRIGINGASIATFISYFVVFIIRLVDTQKICRFKILPGKIIINLLFLSIMMLSIIYIKSIKIIYIPLLICTAIIILLNMYTLKKAAKRVVPDKIRRHIPFIN